MPSRRFEPALLAVGLVGMVCGLDLLWALTGISTGSLAYGFIDEPAHLATCILALLALRAAGVRLSPAFCAAALIASVAIDVDHVPGYLSWDGLIGDAPRPYSHGLLTVATFLLLGFLVGGRYKPIMLGIAFGVGSHLLRDVATGPGVALGLPFASGVVQAPYQLYVGILAAAVALVGIRSLSPHSAIARPAGLRGLVGGRVGGALLAVAVATALLAAASVPAATGDPIKRPQATGKHKEKKEKRAQRSRSRVAMGIYVPGADRDPSLLDEYTAAIGRQPVIVHTYRRWDELPFDEETLRTIASQQAVPLITWELWDRDGNSYDLWEIAAGAYDGYIAAAARQAATWGGLLFVRFAHEMNGSWYPWGRNRSANTPVAFKAAWRRVVSIFRREGASNVRWVWTPYVDIGRLPFRRYYPGDQWVDWAGFDGFNWGRPFQSFAKVFEASYRTMTRMTRKPLMIAETGSVEGAGEAKAIWIRRALRRSLPRMPHVRAVVWWSDLHPDGTDWRIGSSASALGALAAQLQAPRYRPGPDYLLASPTWRSPR